MVRVKGLAVRVVLVWGSGYDYGEGWVSVRITVTVNTTETSTQPHTCQLYVFRTESPSFSSRQNLRPRHLSIGCFSFSGHHFAFPVIIPMSGLCKKTAMASR